MFLIYRFFNWIFYSTLFTQLPHLPERSELGFVTKHYYNQAVKGSIRFIKMTPCYIGQGIKKASDGMKQLMEAPAAPVSK